MQVTLAGYNVDADVISERLVDDPSPVAAAQKCTPEVLCAAYARISRDPRPIGELRAAAIEDVEAARKSNQNIIFGMGHASIAEHAILNFDITGISRLAIEYLESHRLCAYTEKSQRYITLGKDFVMPHELQETLGDTPFRTLIVQSQALYRKFFPKLLEYFQDSEPGAPKKQQEGWAKEDSRYVALLATSGQLGLTASARNLELIIRRCAASPLYEVREMGKQLHAQASAVAPSLFRHVESTLFETNRQADVRACMQEVLPDWAMREPVSSHHKLSGAVRVLAYTDNADLSLCEALLYKAFPGESFGACVGGAWRLSEQDQRKLIAAALRHLEFYDAVPREFEHVQFTFELQVSASCFAQLKRHRMMTLTPQRYDPALAPTVPESIHETGLEEAYLYHCCAAADVYSAILKAHGPQVAEYALTNGHRRRVLVTMNLREMYHFARMRQDSAAQWDIRNIANQMVEKAREVAPLGMMLACGKDTFHERVAREYDSEWAKQKKQT